jgi:mRNA interferase HicA
MGGLLVKRRELVRRLTALAAQHGEQLLLVREGARHTVYRVGSRSVVVPRHREINELTASAILADAREGLAG